MLLFWAEAVSNFSFRTGTTAPSLCRKEVTACFQLQEDKRHGHQQSPSQKGIEKSLLRQQTGLENRPITENADRIEQENRREQAGRKTSFREKDWQHVEEGRVDEQESRETQRQNRHLRGNLRGNDPQDNDYRIGEVKVGPITLQFEGTTRPVFPVKGILFQHVNGISCCRHPTQLVQSGHVCDSETKL